MSEVPEVSVVIPAYNAASTIGDSIDSVLQQTFTDFEILVVDDCSDDDLSEALQVYQDKRIKLLKHDQNKGAAAARNTAIRAAQGKYIAFLDSDDFWAPYKLKTQLEYMKNASVSASCTSFSMVRLSGRKGNWILDPSLDWTEMLLSSCSVSPGSTMLAERVLFDEDQIGLLAEDMRRLEDWDWLLRYIYKYELGIVEDVLTEVRASGYPAYKTVQVSADQLEKNQIDKIKAHFGSTKLKKFQAGLEIEKSGAAYRKDMYGTAIRHIIQALLISPGRVWLLIKRFFYKFRHETKSS